MKFLKMFIILFGLLLVILGLLVPNDKKDVAAPEPVVQKESEPKANDIRIVKHGFEDYSLQYYFDQPGWFDFRQSYKTKEDAKRMKDYLLSAKAPKYPEVIP